MPLSKEVRELAMQISVGRIFQTETTVTCKGPTVVLGTTKRRPVWLEQSKGSKT